MNQSTGQKKHGRLVCIGTGMCHTLHTTMVSKIYLQRAEVVFGVMPNSLGEDWLKENNPNYHSLQKYYGHGKPRTQTYLEMATAMLEEVRAGKDVVCVLYGHPGVMATIGHLAIGLARKEGFVAKMEPGISAEDCLFADLGLDPCYHGCTSHEATQLLFSEHTVDPNAILILWQISLAGEVTLTKFETTPERLQVMVEFLNQWYDLDHEVIIYEASFFPDKPPRIDRLLLRDLPAAELSSASTLVILPRERAPYNHAMLEKCGLIEADLGGVDS